MMEADGNGNWRAPGPVAGLGAEGGTMVEMTRQQEAFVKADGFAAQQTNAAQALVGRTVRSALVTGDRPTEWDDRNQLILNLDDGTTVVVTGGYSSYTGASQDEYPLDITIEIR